MKRAAVGVILLALIGLSGVPGVEPNPPGKAGGYVAIGTSPDFLDAWRRPPVKGHPPVVPLQREFAIGDTAYVAFIVTGMLPDDHGQANVSVDFKLIKPDGTFMFDEKNCCRVQGPTGSQPHFVVADPALDIIFEPGDPVGRYSLVAVFHDLVSRKAALVQVHLEIREKTKTA